MYGAARACVYIGDRCLRTTAGVGLRDRFLVRDAGIVCQLCNAVKRGNNELTILSKALNSFVVN